MDVVDDSGQQVVDLIALAGAGSGSGVLWSHRTDDLNVNLLAIESGAIIAEHVNPEVDVLLVGIDGEGVLLIDGEPHAVRAGQATIIPRNTRRSIRGDRGRFTYLTCHRRRAGLWPREPHRKGDT